MLSTQTNVHLSHSQKMADEEEPGFQQQQQYYPPQPVQQQPQPPPVDRKLQDQTKCLATASIVLGVMFLFSFAGLCSLGAIALGAVACYHADNDDATDCDRQMACAGVALGAVGFLGLIGLIVFLYFFYLVWFPK